MPLTGVDAVVVNITSSNTVSEGYVTAYEKGTAKPIVSALNPVPSQAVAGSVVVPVDAAGKFTIYTNSTTDLAVDVYGYFTSAVSSSDGRIVSAGLSRILDTRDGTGVAMRKAEANEVITLQVGGAGTVPATGVSAVLVNLTAVDAESEAFVSIWQGDVAWPGISSLNPTTRVASANVAWVKLGADGTVKLFCECEVQPCRRRDGVLNELERGRFIDWFVCSNHPGPFNGHP